MALKEKIKRIFILLTIVIITAFNYSVNAVKINVDGVYQGTNDSTYADGAPLSTITIDENIISNPLNATATLLSNYPGFTFVDLEYLRNHTYEKTVGAGGDLASNPGYAASAKYLVYDESIEGATRITGNTGSMNTFSGDIASF